MRTRFINNQRADALFANAPDTLERNESSPGDDSKADCSRLSWRISSQLGADQRNNRILRSRAFTERLLKPGRFKQFRDTSNRISLLARLNGGAGRIRTHEMLSA